MGKNNKSEKKKKLKELKAEMDTAGRVVRSLEKEFQKAENIYLNAEDAYYNLKYAQ